MTKSESSGSEGMAGTRRARFNRWRRSRPFAGGVLLILASFIIAWVPIHIAGDIILLGKALAPIGLLFAALVFMCGIFALTRPALANIFGVFGVVFTIFSLYGALAGLFVGLIPGIFGGILCYAWRPDDKNEEETGGSGGPDASETTDEESRHDFTSSTEEDEADSDELFGSRSVHSLTGSTVESQGAGGRTAPVAILILTIVVLGAFVQPFIAAAAADSYPAQDGIDGTIVIAEQFSGTDYSHKNVTVDTSNRESVPAARLSFGSASMQGLTIYKNFHTGPQTPYTIKITGSSASAPQGIAFTVSEFYASKLSLDGVIPLARQKWTTCPGKDFMLKHSDRGPLPGPTIDGQDVTMNTHRMSAPTITIENFTLTVQKGAVSTTVEGTPECTTGPTEPVLEQFTPSALEQLVEEGMLPESVLANGSVSSLSAPETVNQSETFTVNATITNTGYMNDTLSVEYRFAGAVKQVKNVTLAPNGSTTVTFEDTANVSNGTYKFGVFLQNGSATGSITVGNEMNASGYASTTTANATGTVGSASTAKSQTTPNVGGASVGTVSTPAVAFPAPTGRSTMAVSNTNGGTETMGTNRISTASQSSTTATTGNSNGGATTSTKGSVATQSVPQMSRRSSTTNTNGGTPITVTKTPTPVVSSNISALTGPDRVKQGRNFTVTARITNTGTKKNVTIPVNYSSFSGNNQTENVTLDPGQSKTVTFTDTVPRNMSGGNYEYNVSTNTSSKTGSLTVPPFNTSTKVSHLSGPKKAVKQGKNFTVTARITNTGNKYGLSILVNYSSFSGNNQTEKITLDPGQSKTVNFTDAVPRNMTGGSYEYTISTNTSSKTGTITVPPFNTSTNVSAVSNDIDTITPGGSFNVTAKVTNIGNKYGLTLPVTYEASDGMKRSQNVTLNPGETKIVTFSDITVPGDKSGGSYEYTVSTNESSVTKNITVATKIPTPTATPTATETGTATATENKSSTDTTTSGTETLQLLFAGMFP